MAAKISKRGETSLRQPEVESQQRTSLMDLPDVVREEILDLLTIQDLLKFRSVSKNSWKWVHQYKKLRKRLADKTIIFNWQFQLRRFNKTVKHLPFTAFDFGREVPLEESRELSSFAKKQRRNIRSLKLHSFSLCVTDFQYSFLESLQEIKSLFIENITIRQVPELPATTPSAACLWTSYASWRLPQTCLSKLEIFGYGSSYKHTYAQTLIKFCPNLKHLRLGWESRSENSGNGQGLIDFLAQKNITFQTTGRLENFEIEFGSLGEAKHHITSDSCFREFCKLIAQMKGKVQLINIQESVLRDLRPDPPSFTTNDMNDFLFSIKSIVGISGRIINLQLPSLESFILDGYGRNHEQNRRNDEVECRSLPWPKLKSVEGHLYMGSAERNDGRSLDWKFYRLLFESNGLSITNLDLTIEFGFSFSPESMQLIRKLPANFPNLKKLRFGCDEFTNSDFINLLSLLEIHTKIEALTLKFTQRNSEELLFGHSASDPILMKLSCLKHLKFEIGNACIRNFGTSAFKDILALMPLQSFEFSVNDAHICQLNVKWTGFEALLKGRFGRTIRDFKLNCLQFNSPNANKILVCVYRIKERCVLNRLYLQPKR